MGDIIASIEPDFNLSISPNASAGILYNPPPSPLYKDADNSPWISKSPVDVTLPTIFVGTLTSNEVTLKTDAVAEPSAILPISPVSAVVGILYNWEPSPLNEPVKEPLNEDAVIPPSTFKDVLISTDEVDMFICSTPWTSIESKLWLTWFIPFGFFPPYSINLYLWYL